MTVNVTEKCPFVQNTIASGCFLILYLLFEFNKQESVHLAGNPLHSTAMEEDLNVRGNRKEDQGRAAKRKRAPQEEKQNVESHLCSAPQKSSQSMVTASR